MQTNTNNVNKTWALLLEVNTKRTSFLCWNRNVHHNTFNTKKILKKEHHGPPPKNRGWAQVLAKDKQFLLLIRHPPCYSYIQSIPVKVLAGSLSHCNQLTNIHIYIYITKRQRTEPYKSRSVLWLVVITIWLTAKKYPYLKWQWIFSFLRRGFLSSITAKTITGVDCIYE
jgi:hypothetical protein